MTLFYLDTSALVKRYNIEEGSDFVNELYSHLERRSERLVTSDITDVEVASAIMRSCRKGIVTPRDALGIIYAFESESLSRVRYIPYSADISYISKKLLSGHALRTGDAIQLASAIEALDIDNDLYMVADDERLCDAAKVEGFSVLRPRSIDAHLILDRLIARS